MKLMLTKIISGGQTGADQAALFAAETLGLATGGWMPKGFKTEAGPRPDLAARFGLIEHSSTSYAERTKSNVLGADGTLIFGLIATPGCRLTKNTVKAVGLPLWAQVWPGSRPLDLGFLVWLEANKIRTLNVAGNREEKNLGIFEATKAYLLTNLKGQLRHE